LQRTEQGIEQAAGRAAPIRERGPIHFQAIACMDLALVRIPAMPGHRSDSCRASIPNDAGRDDLPADFLTR